MQNIIVTINIKYKYNTFFISIFYLFSIIFFLSISFYLALFINLSLITSIYFFKLDNFCLSFLA